MSRGAGRLCVGLALAFLVASVVARPAQAQKVVFSPQATQACLAATPTDIACISQSAEQCMQATPAGQTTYGMTECLWAEYKFWDARLNAAYQQLLRQQETAESDAKTYGYYELPRVAPLRDMQRAWIAFRDAKCDFERAQWGSGTGGGPAMAGCLLQTTAEQALYLVMMAQDY